VEKVSHKLILSVNIWEGEGKEESFLSVKIESLRFWRLNGDISLLRVGFGCKKFIRDILDEISMFKLRWKKKKKTQRNAPKA
jgi:hypothetical protein